MSMFKVELQIGGGWQDGGAWVLGTRFDQNVHVVDMYSSDQGSSLVGGMIYAGEGPIGVRATLLPHNPDGAQTRGFVYTAENQWGGNAAPWHPAGLFRFGERGAVIALSARSSDDGQTLVGTTKYLGEDTINFKATLMGNAHCQHRWTGKGPLTGYSFQAFACPCGASILGDQNSPGSRARCERLGDRDSALRLGKNHAREGGPGCHRVHEFL